MKAMYSLISFLLLQAPIVYCAKDHALVTLEPTWHCLDDNDGSCDRFGGKWVLVGTITFKKKSIQDSLILNQLRLHWNGPSMVLNIPNTLEDILKQGTFCLEKDDLPISFQEGYYHQTLHLTFNTVQ
jgi:hypothetical protein